MMGIYIRTQHHAGEVKVTGILKSVVPVGDKSFGSVPADVFAARLDSVEREFYASAEWQDLVASGEKDRLDRLAETDSFAVPQYGPASVWFAELKLKSAREVADLALATSSPVLWG